MPLLSSLPAPEGSSGPNRTILAPSHHILILPLPVQLTIFPGLSDLPLLTAGHGLKADTLSTNRTHSRTHEAPWELQVLMPFQESHCCCFRSVSLSYRTHIPVALRCLMGAQEGDIQFTPWFQFFPANVIPQRFSFCSKLISSF